MKNPNQSRDAVKASIPTECVRPRNDFVLLRTVMREESAGGVLLPEKSAASRRWQVVAVGPKVEGLEAGVFVEVIGAFGEDITNLPSHYDRDLYITKEANICIRVDGNG